MKKFFSEFKTFISRGNVMDMAVGTIIGAAFTAIVTALSNGILKPLINMIIYYICGGNADALSKMYTPLVPVYLEDGVTLDMTRSVIIDWGAFISAIINFLLIALVLFFILKMFNKVREANNNMQEQIKADSAVLSKEEMRALKAEGKTRKEIKAIIAERRLQMEEEQRIAAEEAKKNAPKTEAQLLQEIVTLLSAQKGEPAEQPVSETIEE